MSAPLYNPAVPFVHPMQGALFAGQMIRIQGQVNSSPNCFAINLQTGPRVNPRDDIALHISPVFTPPPRVVRNTLQAQRWGPEESHGGFPFTAGVGFEILILVEHDEFKLAINGAHFTQYRHRIPVNLVSFIAVDGDVTINSITFEGHGHASAPSAPMMAPSAPVMGMPSASGMPSAGVMPPPYPTGAMAMPPYPPAGPVGPAGGPSSYAQVPMPYTGAPPGAYATPVYPSSGAPQYPSGSAYPSGAYPSGAYPTAGYPSTTYISAGPAYPHRKSSPIPIGGIAAGVGAAALGAAMLGHHPMKKMKKLYKFKHKFKKPKFFKHKFGKFHKGWKHKGWDSSGSSSSEEE